MPQGLYNVIDGFASDADFIANNSSSFKSNILCPFPNRIQKGHTHLKNKQYTLPINFESEQNAIHVWCTTKHLPLHKVIQTILTQHCI
jgi:galactose mutarotase-like enzyme